MAKPAKGKALLNPAMLTLAAMAGWAAAHVPAGFTLASAGVWVCGALTVALLTRAALALAAPLLGMVSVLFSRAMKAMQQQPGAEP